MTSAVSFEDRLLNHLDLHVVASAVRAQHVAVDLIVPICQLEGLVSRQSCLVLRGKRHVLSGSISVYGLHKLELFAIVHVVAVGRHRLHLLRGAWHEKAFSCGLLQLLELVFEALHHDFTWLGPLIVLVWHKLNRCVHFVSLFLD